jgi:hypothetical protein
MLSARTHPGGFVSVAIVSPLLAIVIILVAMLWLAGTASASHLLVRIPETHHRRSHGVYIRQIYEGREVGRISWRLIP